jgi:hypothetical protein
MVAFITIIVSIGLVIGIYIIRKATRSAASSGTARDVVRMPASDSVTQTIEAWASRHGYKLVEEPGPSRTYQATTKLTSTPVFLRVEQIADEYEIQCWVRAAGLGGGGDMAIGAPGMVLKIPRNQAKSVHNELRRELGLPSIP